MAGLQDKNSGILFCLILLFCLKPSHTSDINLDIDRDPKNEKLDLIIINNIDNKNKNDSSTFKEEGGGQVRYNDTMNNLELFENFQVIKQIFEGEIKLRRSLIELKANLEEKKEKLTENIFLSR